MGWVTQTLPAGFVLLALLWLPGTVVLRVLGLRGLVAWAAAPALTSGYIYAAALIAGAVGMPWRPVSALGIISVEVALTLVVLVAVQGFDGRARVFSMLPSFGRRSPEPGRDRPPWRWVASADPVGWWQGAWWTAPRRALGLVVLAAAVVFVVPAMLGMGSATAPQQQWDGIFHLNALRLVQDTGVASNLDGMYGAGVHVYYPATWHALVSLVPGPHGVLPWVSITAAANASTLAFGGVVWPLVVAGWSWAVLPGRRLIAVLAAAVCGALPMFPIVMWTIQAVWPNGTAVLLVPGACALVLLAVRRGSLGVRARTSLVALAVLAVAGAGAMHGTALFDCGLILVPALGVVAMRWVRSRLRAGHRARVVGASLTILLFALLAVGAASRSATLSTLLHYERPMIRPYWVSVPRTVIDWVITAWPGDVVLTACIVVGAVVLWRRRHARWMVVSTVIVVVTAAVAAGPNNPIRAVTGLWYAQPMRIEALYPMLAAVLGAVGLERFARWLWVRYRACPASRWSRLLAALGFGAMTSSRRSGGGRVGAIAWLLLASFVVSAGYQAPSRAAFFADSYDAAAIKWGAVASPAELSLLRAMGRYVPRGSTVAGSPYSGIPLAYALAGVRSVYLQLGSASTTDPARALVRKHFRDLHRDPAVCVALRKLHADYFYDDPATAADGARTGVDAPGFDDVDVSQGFVPIAHAGSATLYRITVCQQHPDVSEEGTA